MATQSPSVMTQRGTEYQEIKIVSHSNLFYWWPVWAVGYLMAILGGTDSGKVAWAKSVLARAKETGLGLDARGNLVELAR